MVYLTDEMAAEILPNVISFWYSLYKPDEKPS